MTEEEVLHVCASTSTFDRFSASGLYLPTYFRKENPREYENSSVASGINHKCSRYSFLSTSVKLRKTTIDFVIFVCPHGTIRSPLDGFL
jgi:Ulp1 family protease